MRIAYETHCRYQWQSAKKLEYRDAPHTVYSLNSSGIVRPIIPTAWIYTMNVREEEFQRDHYMRYLELWEHWSFDEAPEVIYAFNTWQFDDYSKYVSDYFDEKDKASYRERQFELDCATAFRISQHIVNKR